MQLELEYSEQPKLLESLYRRLHNNNNNNNTFVERHSAVASEVLLQNTNKRQYIANSSFSVFTLNDFK